MFDCVRKVVRWWFQQFFFFFGLPLQSVEDGDYDPVFMVFLHYVAE